MKKIVTWTVFATLLFCSSVRSGEYSVTFQTLIDGANGYVWLDPILDSDHRLSGFIFCDTAQDQIDLMLSPNAPILALNLEGSPRKSIHRFSPDRDTLYIFVALSLRQVDDRIWELPALTRLEIGPDTVLSETRILDPYYITSTGDIFISDVDLAFADHSAWPGINVSATFRIRFDDKMIDRGRVIDYASTSVVCSDDLQRLLLRQRASGLVTGRLGNESALMTGYFDNQQHIYDFSTGSENDDRGEVRSTTVGLSLNTDQELIQHRSLGGTTGSIHTGNFAPDHAGDELIYVGNSEDLLGLHPTRRSHIACYSFDGNSLNEVWYHETPAFDLRYLSRHNSRLVGMNDRNQVVQIDCHTGRLADSTDLGFPVATSVFFATGSENSELNLALLSGRSVMVVRLEESNRATRNSAATEVPQTFVLYQNHPNPFNGETSISFDSDVTQHLSLSIFNILGQEIASLFEGVVFSGNHRVSWDGTDDAGRPQASGIYFARLSSPVSSEMVKLIYLK